MSGKTIESFLDLYPKNNTKKVYRAAVYDFLDHLYGRVRAGSRVTADEKTKYEELCARYFAEERDRLNDLVRYIAAKNGTPPASIRGMLTGLKEWLSFNEVDFSPRELKTLRHKMPRAKGSWTVESEFDLEVLRKIIVHMDEKGVAMVLTLASSGIRIGEALNVKLRDLNLSKEPPEIIIRGDMAKGYDTRVTFMSKEAKAAVEAWLHVRDAYIMSALNRNRGLIENGEARPKRRDDDRLFPFSEAVVREFWINALKKAGLATKDTSTNRLQYRVHGLRKFFRSQLALGCPRDIVEELMGHEGYLTDAYRRFTRKQMGEYYLKAEHHVTILGSGDIEELSDRLRDTSAAVKGYKDIINEQALDIAKLNEQIELQQREITGLKDLEKERGNVDTIAESVIQKITTDSAMMHRFYEQFHELLIKNKKLQ